MTQRATISRQTSTTGDVNVSLTLCFWLQFLLEGQEPANTSQKHKVLETMSSRLWGVTTPCNNYTFILFKKEFFFLK